jgi:hypothetical protein
MSKTYTGTCFWYSEYKGYSTPKTWKKVFAQYVEGGVRLVYRQGTSKAIFIHLTGVLPSLTHAMFWAKDRMRADPKNWQLRGPLPHDVGDIVIEPPRPGYDRFKEARDLQSGCNPSGIARELVRIIAAAMNDPACKGTDDVRNDAAVITTIDKLQSLCLRDAIPAHSECRIRVEGPRSHEQPIAD